MRKPISSNPDFSTRSNEFVAMAKLLMQSRGDIQSAAAMAEARNQSTASAILKSAVSPGTLGPNSIWTFFRARRDCNGPVKASLRNAQERLRTLCHGNASGDEGSPFWHHLFAWLSRGPPGARQLQHRCVLTLPKFGNKHGLPVGELQRIMMRRLLEVHLPEAGDLVGALWGPPESERRVAPDLFFECKFCPREQTDGYARLAWVRKAERDRIWKMCRYKLVADLGGSGRNMVKTVVTHRTPPLCTTWAAPLSTRITAEQHDHLMASPRLASRGGLVPPKAG